MKIIKWTFKIVLILVILLIIILAFLLFMMYDSTNLKDYSIYHLDENVDTVTSQKLDEALNLENKNSIDIVFDENELNNLIYVIVKETIKSDYNPESGYISGTNNINAQNIYTEIENNKLNIFVPVKMYFVKSAIKITLSFNETIDQYIAKIDNIKLGKINLNTFSSLYEKILESSNISSQKVNNSLQEKGYPISCDLTKKEFYINKSEIKDLIIKFSKQEEATSYVELINSLTSDFENVSLGIVDNKLGVRINLESIKNTQTYTIKQDFNYDDFVQEKSQTLLMSNLNSSENKIIFSDYEINNLLYCENNGYQDFNFQYTIMENVELKFIVDLIYIEFNSTQVTFNVVATFNGFQTIFKIYGDIYDNNTNNVRIKLNETMKLGNVDMNIDFIIDSFSTSLQEIGFMNYDVEGQQFIINEDSFKKYLSGTTSEQYSGQLQVDKIAISEGKIVGYVSVDPSIQALVDSLTNEIEQIIVNYDFSNILENDSEALNTINEISEQIENGSLTDEAIDSLLDVVNNMADDSKKEFYDTIKDQMDASQLEQLYNSLFN